MKIVLIDAKYLLYVQHWSHKDLFCDGFPTGAMYGFFQEMLRLNELWPGAHQIFCWDGQGPSWKKEAGAGYKENRTVNPDVTLVMKQEKVMQKLLLDLGFMSICVPGVEADDLIGILSNGKLWPDHLEEIRIYSGDEDMYQLVGGKTYVWKKFRKRKTQVELEVVDSHRVEQEYGVPPKHVCQIRAMAGDSSDNLKGLPGIGPVKALNLFACGVKPDTGWHNLAPAVRQSVSQFSEHWDRINKEFRIITIPREVDGSNFDEATRYKLSMVVKYAVEFPHRRFSSGAQQAWMKFIGTYNMKDLFEVRHLLWNIS